MRDAETVPYLNRVSSIPDCVPNADSIPFNLPFVAELDLTFKHPVTFLVCENGTGKSTLIEALAVLCRLPVGGDSRNELGAAHAPEVDSPLSGALRPSFRARPRDGYFPRAEFHSHFASLLDLRREDPDFRGDPYQRYGGRSLGQRSHGEAFLAVAQNRLHSAKRPPGTRRRTASRPDV